MYSWFYCFMAVSSFLGVGTALAAKEFPKMGHTFPIHEENILEAIQKKTRADIKGKKEEEFQKRLLEKFERPAPVEGLLEAREYHSFYYDPSHVVRETVEYEGKVIIKQGDRVNPLQKVTLPEGLLFFDGDKKEHLAWAREQGEGFKWILVKGAPLLVEKEESERGFPRQVFFDQMGALCSRFGIKKVPCRLSQQGLRILIEEIPYWDGRGLP